MVRFLALSGTTDVTENSYLYESGPDMIMVDCGVWFSRAGNVWGGFSYSRFSYVKETNPG